MDVGECVNAFSRGGSALAWLCNGKEYTEAKDRILRIAPALIIFPRLLLKMMVPQACLCLLVDAGRIQPNDHNGP